MKRLSLAVAVFAALATAMPAQAFQCALTLKHDALGGFSDAMSEVEVGAQVAALIADREWIAAEGAAVERVERVTARLLSVARKRSEMVYTVQVLATAEKGACAYPGGFVFLTRGLVEMTRNDDELAFVIAHELAHVTTGQTDRPVERELAGRLRERFTGLGFAAEMKADVCRQTRPRWPGLSPLVAGEQETRKIHELHADEEGIVYAALAGYRTSAAHDILDRLTGSGPCQPAPEERKQRIAARLNGIVDRIAVFQAGVRFHVQGDYEKAASAFRGFLNIYPGAEVHHNLATAYHRWALTFAPAELAAAVKCSVAVETRTSAGGVRAATFRAAPSDSRRRILYRTYIKLAQDQYRKALAKRPDYAPARANLGCALVDLADYAFAQAHLGEALKANPKSPLVHNNLGVALLMQGNHAKARAHLEKAAALDSRYDAPHFNLARLWEVLGDTGRAMDTWKRYVTLAPGGTSVHGAIARRALGMEAPATDRFDVREWTSLKRHTQTLGDPDRRMPLFPVRGGTGQDAAFHSRLVIDVHDRDGVSFLREIDGGGKHRLRQMVVSEPSGLGTADGLAIGAEVELLRSTLGKPSRVTEGIGGRYLVYEGRGLAFLVRHGDVKSWFVFQR